MSATSASEDRRTSSVHGVHDLDAAAVGRQVDVLAVERQVPGRVPRPQDVGGRSRLEGRLDDVPGHADDAADRVDRRPVRLPDRLGPLGREPDADALDDVQGGGVDPADRRRGEDLQPGACLAVRR